MTVDEARGLMLSGPVMLALDTNAVWGSARRLNELLDLVNQANAALKPGTEDGPLQVCVSALVHAERTRQLRSERTEKGLPFSIDEINRNLARKRLTVYDFTKADAEGTSAHLFGLCPTPAEWRAAKKKKGSDAATVDWFIAGHASARRWLTVTEDNGPEWKNVGKISRTVLEQALKSIIGE